MTTTDITDGGRLAKSILADLTLRRVQPAAAVCALAMVLGRLARLAGVADADVLAVYREARSPFGN